MLAAMMRSVLKRRLYSFTAGFWPLSAGLLGDLPLCRTAHRCNSSAMMGMMGSKAK